MRDNSQTYDVVVAELKPKCIDFVDHEYRLASLQYGNDPTSWMCYIDDAIERLALHIRDEYEELRLSDEDAVIVAERLFNDE